MGPSRGYSINAHEFYPPALGLAIRSQLGGALASAYGRLARPPFQSVRPQGEISMNRVIAGLFLAAAALVTGPAAADGVDVPRKVHRVWHGYNLRLPPERHVIEIVDNYGRLTIGGRRFTPVVPACGGWVAGERVRFVAFDGPDACRTAVIYNYHSRQTCEVICPRGFALW
jgi:hypothetical protein